MIRKSLIALLTAATLATTAFAQTTTATGTAGVRVETAPPALPNNDPRLTNQREQLQKTMEQLRITLEEMQKNMPAGQGADMNLPRLIIEQAGGVLGGAAAGVPAPGGPQNFFFQIGDPGKKEKAAYLGTSTSPTNATTREQLKLPKGIGLTVDFVDKDSPAQTAGLQQHDVLTKIDDQLLVNMPQLATLVRTHKAGDSVKLTFIRAGETKTIDIKLVEKELPVLDENIMNIQPFTLPVPPPGVGGPRVGGPDIMIPRPGNDGGPAWQPAGRVTVKTENGVTVRTLVDDDQRLTLAIDKDGSKNLAVEKIDKAAPQKDGDIIFSGPVDTDDQRKKLPAGVDAKLKRLESDRVGGIRLGGGVGIGNPGAIVINGNAAGGGVNKMIVQRSDGQHSIRIETTNGDRHLTVKDKSGAVLFDGPINTDEERKKIPAEVADKIPDIDGRK